MKKNAEKKAPKKSDKKASPAPAPEKPAVPAAPAEVKTPKNIMTLDNGEQILVRGPEKKRAGYHMGNVGWQDMLRSCRLDLNLATYASKVGASDTVIADLVKKCDASIADLNAKRVTIPSDMVTQHIALKNGVSEATVGSPDYILALRKFVKLVQAVNDPILQKEAMQATTANKQALAK